MKKIIYGLCIIWITACVITTAKEEFFYFQFDNEELVDVVHRLAAKKEINIVFPVKSPLTARVTMFINDPFTLDQAWEKLNTILDLAGYSLIDKGSQCTIVKTEKNIIQEPLPIYIGVPPEKIPDSDERIRYIYYLTNLKIDGDFNKTDLHKILENLLPEKTFLSDPLTNALIIIDKANNIKALMDVLVQLDSATYHETFEVIQLHNTDPNLIRSLFDDILKTANAKQYQFEPKKQLSESSYFPKNVRTIALPRTNSLLVLGNKMAIDRVRDFITKYIDVELESGKSILHIYKLQYMEANQIVGILRKVLKLDEGGTGQSSEAGKSAINPKTQERAFDKIIIKTDGAPKDSGKDQYYGNNNIIVACRNDDWVHIKSLIEQLDQAQPQVIIEVLIANLTLNEVHSLGALTANPNEINFPPGVNLQAAQIGGGVVISPFTPPIPPTTTLADSITALTDTNPVTAPGGGTVPGSVVQAGLSGATVLAINNGTMGTAGALGSAWTVLQMLDLFSYTKVIAHPHLIATNGKTAKVAIGQTRLISDQTTGSGGGTTVVKLKDIPAIYTVTVTPQIYTSETPGGKDDAVSLKVNVDIVDFLPGANTANARLNRTVDTCALLKNGQILALGGLIDHEVDDSVYKTPIFGNIPILGWFMKSRGTTRTNSNLTIFIAPTIIEPRLRGGASKYTEDYVKITKQYSQEAELFDSLQDPVTRWFFKRAYKPQEEIKDFMDQDEFKRKSNVQLYKSVIDVEQAASVEETSTPPKEKDSGKKAKRIVLSNLNDKQNDKTPDVEAKPASSAPSAPNTKVCAAPEKQLPPAQTQKAIDPVTEQVKLQPETTTIAKADLQKLDRAMLKDQLQKMLAAEDNPLL